MIRQKYIAILVPFLVVLASAAVFGMHYNMVSYGQGGVSFHINAAHADGGEGDGGGGSGDGGGNDGGNDNGGGGIEGDGGGGSGDIGGGNQGDGGGGSGDVGTEGDGGGGSGDVGNDNPGGNDNNPPPAPAPTCAFAASAYSVAQGTPLYLAWQSTNATSVTIDHSVGSVSPVAIGNVLITPNTTTTYAMTASGAGGSAVCYVTVTVTTPPPPPSKPTCTLSASPTAIKTGDNSQLSWTSTNATSASLDNGIGAVAAINSSVTVHPTATTKYNLTVNGPGGSVVCSATVTVTKNPPVTPKPLCTLSANPKTINAGDASTLTWTTSDATSFTIDNSVGSVTPVGAGSKSVSPAVTTTYTGTATGPGGTVTCAAAVTVTPKPPGAPSCTLSASPSAVSSGGHTKLTWTTDNADTFTIDQGVGSVSPANAGSVSSKAISSNTTFTGRAVSPTGVVATCTAAVTVNTGGGGGGPSCTMTATPSSYTRGGRATITWGGSEIANVDIDNGIATATTSSGSVVVAPANLGTYTYTGTFHATNGQTLTCKASFTVTGGSGGGGGCTSNCGGGGGGGTPSSVITLSALPHATTQPLTYLYLSQIPYTGLDLGTFGTILYWVGLIGWSLALAYLVLFGVLPYVKRKLQSFGEQVTATLNTPAVPAMAYEAAQPRQAPAHRPVLHADAEQRDTTDRYSSFDGFKSFAREEVLSVEDIVKGLSRVTSQAQRAVAPAAPEPVAPAEQAYVSESVPVVTPAPTAHAEAAVPATVRGLVSAILERDKEAVFSALRMHVRGGGEPETLLTPTLCMIDDVYRSRIDGTPCDESVSRLAARLDTPTLEKLVASLTTAIDASYATSVTGAKLALTRALAALGA